MEKNFVNFKKFANCSFFTFLTSYFQHYEKVVVRI